MTAETMSMRGVLEGHGGWVTQIATTPEQPDMILSASRDKSIIVWTLTRAEGAYGTPRRALLGHSHYVSDVVISSDSSFALSGSWDGCLRLWDINTGACTRTFKGHTKDVLSVAFSADNRQVVSGSRDCTIKLWNVLAECKYTFEDQNAHTRWVSCVRFSPSTANPVIVSCGWDNVVKVWNLSNCSLRCNHIGHTGYLNTVTVSPEGSLRLGRQGWQGHAVGPQRQPPPVHAGCQEHHQRPDVQPQPLLAVRRSWPLYQDLGSREQGLCR